jgi:HTH-type transcriptional regulator/antitoxin HipB
MELNPETISAGQLLALLGAYDLDLVVQDRAIGEAEIQKFEW